ncbi:MAG: hypothetical protein Q8Q31_05415 [Nanoarchaeota archaeon]|nr:hypothetical protein [Nanoarchaeota archaeon]
MGQEKALVAFHSNLAGSLTPSLERKGYEVTVANTVDEMLQYMGLSPLDSPERKPPVSFRYYMMDTNLGFENGPTCDPASKIYSHIRTEVESGQVGFLSLTENNTAIRLAQEAKIPVVKKTDADGLIDFLRTIKHCTV